MAVATDTQITTKYEANKDGFVLLSKTRAEISAMIPQSGAGVAIESDPSVLAIKDALAQLEVHRQAKEKIMNDGVAMNDSLSCVEDLMKVYQNQANKEEVFSGYRNKFTEHFAQNEAIEQEKQQIAVNIQ